VPYTKKSQWLVSLCFVLALLFVLPLSAQVPSAPSLNASSYILIDFNSGRIITSLNPDTQLDPASITKLMTTYVVFHELKNQRLSLEEKVTVSEKAWKTPGSRMFIEVGSTVSIDELLRGIIIQSGNDASVAIAEHVAGSEETFASLMNQYAKDLGMINTHYENATGLPSNNHKTSAADIAKLAIAIISEFPEFYVMYSEKEYTYDGIRQHNRNNLLWRDPAVDGLKTGHTDAAGYCLAASAKRGNTRLISVVMNADDEKLRADDSQKLLNYGFRFYETHKLYESNQQLDIATVWKGQAEQVGLTIAEDIYITIPRGQYERLEAKLEVRSILTAPITAGEAVGRLKVMLGNDVQAEVPLLALDSVAPGGFWRRFSDSIALWFHDF